MQKAKKMSKQTLVVAVLAILLVLSLALSVTGAWFTDTASAEKTTDIKFATVAIGDATLNEAITLSNSRNKEQVLPGDTIGLEGAVATEGASTVKIYVAIYLADVSVTFKTDKTADYADLEAIVDAGHITVRDLELTVDGTGADEVSQTTYAGMIVYTIDANADVTFDYAGSVKFEDAFTNNYAKNGVTYVMNNNGNPVAGSENVEVVTDVKIAASVKVAAIQFDNIGETAAVAELARLVSHPGYTA